MKNSSFVEQMQTPSLIHRFYKRVQGCNINIKTKVYESHVGPGRALEVKFSTKQDSTKHILKSSTV